MSKPRPVALPFSSKYDQQHAQNYLHKHQAGPARRLSHWRDVQVGRAALRMAGDPNLVLDLPCGAGRFWPMLAEHPNRVILAADNSADMIATALAAQPPEVVRQVRTFKTSAFDITLGNNSVDCVFCIRLLHHFQSSEHRLAALREFHRVTRDTVIVSLWVDGNYKAWRRNRLDKRRGGGENRFVVRRQAIELEFLTAGFQVLGYSDFLPGYAMWRTYTLRKREVQ